MKNRFIEFLYFDKEFIKFMLLKLISLIVDMCIIGSLLFLLFMVVLPLDLINIMLYFMLLGIGYNMITILSFKRTIGMMVGGLHIVSKSGYFITTFEIFSRAFLNSFYTLPFIGAAGLLTSFIVIPIYKGISIIDFMSKTIIVSRTTYLELISEEEEFLEKQNL